MNEQQARIVINAFNKWYMGMEPLPRIIETFFEIREVRSCFEEWDKEALLHGAVDLSDTISDEDKKLIEAQLEKAIFGSTKKLPASDALLEEAVEILQKIVTDTNPEQVMQTYESIHVFLNKVNK